MSELNEQNKQDKSDTNGVDTPVMSSSSAEASVLDALPIALTTPPSPLSASDPPRKKKRKGISRKTRRRIIRLIVLLCIAGGIGYGVYRYLGNRQEVETEVIQDVVEYGAITSMVEGSGLAKAKNSETVTAPVAGTITELLVGEGDNVTAGDLLFRIDSPAARDAVDAARSTVEGYEKQIESAQKDYNAALKRIENARRERAELLEKQNVKAEWSGRLIEAARLYPGDHVNQGDVLAKINDDTRLKLEQYYSYAYADMLYQGQAVEVTVPSLMSTVSGVIADIHMVRRISPEGAELFCAEIVVDNPGSLTADMSASAAVNLGGEIAYPYEQGQFAYYRTGTIVAGVSGKVAYSNLVDYLQVSAGQVLARVELETKETEEEEVSDSAILSLRKSLGEAQKALEEARENLNKSDVYAAIDGTVIGLSLAAGDEVAVGAAAMTISDTSALVIDVNVDERNIAYIKPGMEVTVNQWETPSMGVVETVSMNASVNNGVATYPVSISVDNAGGELRVNSYMDFQVLASQNEHCLILPLQCVRQTMTEDGEMINVVYVSGERPENAMDLPAMDEEIPEGYWPVPVEIGISDNFNVEIRSGVDEGTTVFTETKTLNSWGF